MDLILPATEGQWRSLCKKHGINHFGVNYPLTEKGCSSASKIGMEQLLGLKALVLPTKPGAEFESYLNELSLSAVYQDMKAKLRETPGWDCMLASLANDGGKKRNPTPKELEAWVMVKEYNHRSRMGDSSSAFAPPKVLDPEAHVSQRTRSKIQAAQQPQRPQTPPQAARSRDTNIEDINEILAGLQLGSPINMKSSISPMSPEQHLDGKEGPEVTANVALVHLFCTADILISDDRDRSWSFEQTGFKFQMRGGKSGFTARVDGVLEETDSKTSLVIIEVKPGLRGRNTERYGAQECAEAVAWAMSTKPRGWDKEENKNRKFRRLIMSQAHHEIYIITVEFGPDWIRNMLGEETERDGFISLTHYGPCPNSNPRLLELATVVSLVAKKEYELWV
ncbi:hypothetical protein F4803DRAFT_557377 [Xylaria telfairii]|nr:hypothetical protein F4803DRAFT_557377 [Xylaria telfairii]